MSSLLEQAFGKTDVDLYADVLKVPKTCTLAQLRKAYYKQALQYHPDKNPGDEEAKLKFQAVSWTYQLLKDPEKRKDYDEEGVIPHDDDIDDGEDKGPNAWKDYFDTIFGKLTKVEIDTFAMKYKMSEEEEQDVLKYYEQLQGNLTKMLGFVMLSEERDVNRWLEDYIYPAIDAGKVQKYSDTLNKTLKKVLKKLEKQTENNKEADTDETETEESDDEEPAQKKPATKKVPPKKAKPTKAKQKKSSQDDLIAAIRNKNGRGNPLAALGARYGVSMDDDDPLDDANFAKIQSKFTKKK